MKIRDNVVDLIKVVAILGVMGNHLMYPVSSRGDFFGGFSWWIAFFIYTFSLVAVPIFIMISGYLLIDRTDSIQKNFKRTLKRLVVPLLFWFSFYLIWKVQFRSVSFSALEIMQFFVSGNMFIYYFLVILIGLYLLLPIIQIVAKYGSDKLHSLILYGSFSLTWFVGIANYFFNFGGTAGLLTKWIPFFSYFWWGFMVKKKKFKNKSFFLELFIWGSVIVFFTGYVSLFLKAKDITMAFKGGVFYWHDYLNPAVSLMSVGLFTWAMLSNSLKKITVKPVFNKIIFALASLAYAAYLVHMFVIDYIDIKYGYAIEFAGDNLVSFVTIRPLLAIVLSFAIGFLISKIPYLKKTVGS